MNEIGLPIKNYELTDSSEMTEDFRNQFEQDVDFVRLTRIYTILEQRKSYQIGR